MSLCKTPPGKTSPTSLPYDIFLNIMDALIFEAQTCKVGATWMLEYRYDAPSKLSVAEPAEDQHHGPKHSPRSASQLSRFFNTRIPSQINHKTRSMVHRAFPRATLVNCLGELTIDAWLRPEMDSFMPFFAKNKASLTAEMHFRQVLLLPPPQCAPLLRGIRSVIIPHGCYFSKLNTDAVSALATLPNLQMVLMDIGHINTPRGEKPCHHAGAIPIDGDLFPDLAFWATAHGPSFDIVYQPLAKRGIPFYGCTTSANKLMMEIFSCKQGIHIKLLSSDCTCPAVE